MTWAVFLADTTTGVVGARVPLAAGGSWTDTINGPTQAQAVTSTAWLLGRVERRWWAPWSGSLLVCHEHGGDLWPVAWGPITAEPQSDRDSTTLTAGGLWSLLEHRVVTDGDHGPGEEKALAKSALALEGLSLGSIGWRLVQAARDRPLGWFPVAHGSPDETTGHQRTYRGFNLSNNTVAKRLQELTEVVGGPDIAFRPRWVDGRRDRVEWVMVHGTEAVPEIGQENVFTVDCAAPRSNAVAMRATAKSDPVGRVYATGAGQDEATLIVTAQRALSPGDHVPMLERVVSDGQVDDPDLLGSRARAALAEGAQRVVQVGVDVSASDPVMPAGAWWAGDRMDVVWPGGWPQLSAGVHQMTLVSRTGQLGSDKVSCEFQEVAVA